MTNGKWLDFRMVNDFSEVKPFYRQLFAERRIRNIYKMRNWEEKHHPEFLNERQMYFSPPNELNDPFDIHRPVRFDVSVIETPEFLQRMIDTVPAARGINPGNDAKAYAENELEQIRKGPQRYFLKNYEDLVNSEEYNKKVGVLSLTTDPVNEQTWGYYGGGLKGFAVGFDPMKLCAEIFSEGQFVEYTKAIPVSNIINASLSEQSRLMFQKHPKWQFENEFRFVRFMDNEKRRFHYYNAEIVNEIILGVRIKDQVREQIIPVIQDNFPHVKVL